MQTGVLAIQRAAHLYVLVEAAPDAGARRQAEGELNRLIDALPLAAWDDLDRVAETHGEEVFWGLLQHAMNRVAHLSKVTWQVAEMDRER